MNGQSSGRVYATRATCGAQLRAKPAGTLCGKRPMKGRTRCELHGGESPRGPEHPRFMHGKYSDYIPADLERLAVYGANHPELLRMNGELDMLDRRAAQLMRRLQTGESAKRWTDAQELARAVLSFREMGDGEELDDAISELCSIVLGAPIDDSIWGELRQTWDLRRRIARVETQRMQAEQQTITIGELMAIIAAIMAIFRGRCDDPQTLSLVNQDLRDLLNREAPGQEYVEGEAVAV